jgi:hypothetical protein
MNYITFVMSMGDIQYYQHNNFDIPDKCYQHWLQYGAEAKETTVGATVE